MNSLYSNKDVFLRELIRQVFQSMCQLLFVIFKWILLACWCGLVMINVDAIFITLKKLYNLLI